MNELEMLKARLSNTEKALFALATVLQPLQPPDTQEAFHKILGDYFDANVSLGFQPSAFFVSKP